MAEAEGGARMSRSKANELMQTLVERVTGLWSGKIKGFTADDAYDLCREIVREADKERGDDFERDKN